MGQGKKERVGRGRDDRWRQRRTVEAVDELMGAGTPSSWDGTDETRREVTTQCRRLPRLCNWARRGASGAPTKVRVRRVALSMCSSHFLERLHLHSRVRRLRALLSPSGRAHRGRRCRAGVDGGRARRPALHGAAWRRRVRRAGSRDEALHDLRAATAGLPRLRARQWTLPRRAGAGGEA